MNKLTYLQEAAQAILQGESSSTIREEKSLDSVQAWLFEAWLSPSVENKIDALTQALELDPENELALQGLQWVEGISDAAQTAVFTDVEVEDTESSAESDSDCCDSEQDDCCESKESKSSGFSLGTAVAAGASTLFGFSKVSGSASSEDDEEATDEAKAEAKRLVDEVEAEHEEEAEAQRREEEAEAQRREEEAEAQRREEEEAEAQRQADEAEARQAEEEAEARRLEQEASESTEAEIVATEVPSHTLGAAVASTFGKLPVPAAEAVEANEIEQEIQAEIAELSDEVQEVVAEAPKAPEAASSDSSDSVLILAVDDSPTIRKLVSLTLEREGFEVITACDGLEAVQLLSEHMPNLILSDVNMPRLDGYKLCRFVKKCERTKHIPVVMLSGKDGVFDKLRGKMFGCGDYITKPFESAELIEKVRLHTGIYAS